VNRSTLARVVGWSLIAYALAVAVLYLASGGELP
jgi:hypothetical protein